MKKMLLIFIMLITAMLSYANEPLARDSVIQASGLTAQQIYDSLKKWFVANAKYDSRYIIEHDDAANKHLVGKMNFRYQAKHINYAPGSGHISVVIEIMARDGRFKIRMTNFCHTSEHPKFANNWSVGTVTSKIPEEWATGWKNTLMRGTYERVFKRCQEFSNQLLQDIAEYAKDFKPIEEEDW